MTLNPAPVLAVADRWEEIFNEEFSATLEDVLLKYLKARRWFRGKGRRVSSLKVKEALPVPGSPTHVVTLQVEYADGDPETYLLPLAFASGERAERVLKELSHTAIAQLQGRSEGAQGVLYDALMEKEFALSIFEAISRGQYFKGPGGEVLASSTAAFRKLLGTGGASLEPSFIRAEQSNSSVVYGDRFILKVFRRLEPGVNPELEIGRFLTERNFANTAPLAGALEYRTGNGETMTLGVLQGFVPKGEDGWQYTMDALGRFFERTLVLKEEAPATAVTASLVDLVQGDLHPTAYEMAGTYLEWSQLLAQRTAELHLTLASDREDPDFAPDPFTILAQRSLYQSRHNLTVQALQLLRHHLRDSPASAGEVKMVLDLKAEILRRFRAVLERKITGLGIRTHGDYHLGQVLFTGKDFVIIDFEGEPSRPLSERRIKRSPLWDVAGMLRSFHYAAHAALWTQGVSPEDRARLEPWVRHWHLWVSRAFLKTYLQTSAPAGFLPRSQEELQVLLEGYLLEKAIYELMYEINNRPEWLGIPLRGVLEILGHPPRV